MSDYESVFKKQELHEMYVSGEVVPLSDLYLIEDTALTVKDLNKKIDFYKDYKKKKAKDIDGEIKTLNNKVDFFKSIIMETLKTHKEKSIKFPGSCSVSSRNPAPKWVINDEDKLIEVLKEAEKNGEKIDDILQETIVYKVDKKKADKLMEVWEKNGKLDKILEDMDEPFIVKEIPPTSVALSFVKDNEEEDDIVPVSVPKKSKVVKDDNVLKEM